MDPIFWSRLHGGMTHFPIAFVVGAAFFDIVGFFLRDSSSQRNFRITGYWLIILGGIGSFGAVFSGLALSKWNIGGTGLVLQHHLFVWSSFALIIGLTSWRVAVGKNPSPRSFTISMSILGIAGVLISAAGWSGGEVLIGR